MALPYFDDSLKNAEIVDLIANPTISHFFNTDCVSCHTETTRRQALQLVPGAFAYALPEGVAGVSQDVLPANKWNVRNFGWFETAATITQRTANETAQVVEFIRSNLLTPPVETESDTDSEEDSAEE